MVRKKGELTEGASSLFSYQENGFSRFFYAVNNSQVNALIYKRYQKEGVGNFQYNRNYLNQLFVEVNCQNKSIEKLENVKYTANDLTAWFRKDNECRKTPQQSFGNTKKHTFSPKLFTGVHLLHYKAGSPGTAGLVNIDYGEKSDYYCRSRSRVLSSI